MEIATIATIAGTFFSDRSDHMETGLKETWKTWKFDKNVKSDAPKAFLFIL